MPTFQPPIKLSAFTSLFLATALASAPCFADEWPSHPLPIKSSEAAAYARAIGTRPSFDTCIKNSEGTTPGLRDCLREEHGFQDRRLNQTYKELMGSLNETDRKSLREEERRWIAFRDKFCALDKEPGQGQELDSVGCFVDQTADRATELQSRLDRK